MPAAVLDRVPTLDEVDAEIAGRTLRDYLAWMWPIVEPSTPFVPGWHLDAICDHLEAVTRREIRQLLITVPPRHGKSLTCSVAWPTWAWATDPSLRFLCASYAADLSTEHAVLSRRVVESWKYRAAFGDTVILTTDQNIKTFFENTARGYRISTSVGGAATGRGGDFLLIDDPHSLKEIHSEPIRKEVIRWHDQVWSTRLNDPQRGAKVVIMQRGHDEDLAGHLLEQGGYVHLNLPSEYEPTTWVSPMGWRDPRTVAGDLLSPDRMGPEAIAAAKRTLGSWGYNSQHQQRPAPAEGGLIKRQWWKWYTTLPATFDEILQSWDMTFKATADTDFVAGHVWGRVGADCYLLDRVHDRLTFSQTIAAVRAMSAKWPAAWAKLVEDTANGPAVIDTLAREIPGLIAVKPDGGKVSRLTAVSPNIEAGNAWLPDPTTAPWVNEVVEEAAIFPNGAHDDDCFIAGTPIATLWGDRPIESLRQGDNVITPFGIRLVVAAGLVRLAQTVQRGPLVGTPNHPIFSDGQFVPMDTLTQAARYDMLSVGGMLTWKYKRLLCSTESNTVSWAGRDAITSVNQQQIKEGSIPRDFTLQCMNFITRRQFRMGMRFITWMAIHTITTLTIWSVYRGANIVRGISRKIRRNKESTLNRFVHSRQLGIGLQRAMHGINSTGRRYFQDSWLNFINAFTAVKQLLQGEPLGPSIAVQYAATNTEYCRDTTTRQKAALFVTPHSLPSSRSTLGESPKRVAGHVDRGSLTGAVPTYNLTVEEDHVYYAHGRLVSNCDAMSQALRRLYARSGDSGLTLSQPHTQAEQEGLRASMVELHNGAPIDAHAAAGCPRCSARLAGVN